MTVVLDQLTKVWARSALAGRHFSFLDGHVQLLLTENRGAFLGLGDALPPAFRFAVFTALVGLGLAAGTVWLFRSRDVSLFDLVTVSLLIGGGIGNLIDRAMRDGAVTDFLFMRLSGILRTGVFNVADIFVTTAALMLLTRSVITSRRA